MDDRAQARTVSVSVNGRNYERAVPDRMLLSDFLRQELKLVGTHVGCEHGVCGACTVSCNGEVVRSCLMFAVQADGSDIATIEGLSEGSELGPIQQAFWEEHGLQCGFCTPGMLMVIRDLLKRNPNPDESDVREAISANLCRCTGYEQIINAAMSAAKKLRSAPGGEA